MLLLRKTTRQALLAMGVLAQTKPPLSIGAMSKRTGVSAPTLAKVVHTLAEHGLVKGRRGPGGGFQLARPSSSIQLLELVRIFEHSRFEEACLLNEKPCEKGEHCAFHNAWSSIQADILDLFRSRTVADLGDSPIPCDEIDD